MIAINGLAILPKTDDQWRNTLIQFYPKMHSENESTEGLYRVVNRESTVILYGDRIITSCDGYAGQWVLSVRCHVLPGPCESG